LFFLFREGLFFLSSPEGLQSPPVELHDVFHRRVWVDGEVERFQSAAEIVPSPTIEV
jgi:hypothetical protein